MKKNNFSASKIIALGAGAAALAASTYYFFGPEGKIHRKKAVGWMIKMKGEIVERMEEAGEITETAYHSIVDSVLASYILAGKIAPTELETFAKNLKGQWKNIIKTLPSVSKKAVKKVGKKIAKKVK